jgi:phosphopantothenoylcysteine synthetase/decarboxylase
MNTLMYEHPLTAKHLDIVRNVVGYEVVGPIGKALACGDVGRWFDFPISLVLQTVNSFFPKKTKKKQHKLMNLMGLSSRNCPFFAIA